MKTLILAAAALMVSGSAMAYQTVQPEAGVTTTQTVTVDPNVAIAPPATWTEEQRMLWEQHMAALPASWTVEQRAAFEAMMTAPPMNWTAEQRALYSQHLAALPTTWTIDQRTAYEQQIASLRTPWMSATETASADTTTLAVAPASGRIVHASNANPELDARGIRVISDPAVVPDGYNGHGAGTGMGGPIVDPATGETIDAADDGYPACTATVTDNCIQLYERGVRESAAVGGPFEPAAGETTTAKPADTGTATTTTSGTDTTKPAASDHSGHDSGSTTPTPDPAGTPKDDTTEPDY